MWELSQKQSQKGCVSYIDVCTYTCVRERGGENLREGEDGGGRGRFPKHHMLTYDHDTLLSPVPLLRAVFVINRFC